MKKFKSSNNVFEILKKDKDDTVSVAIGKKGTQKSKIIEKKSED